MKKTPTRRHAVPAPIRMNVWKHYIGDTLQGKCLCCEREAITISNFECGHVVSVAMGGKNTIANMRPICSMCNKSMGTRNMDDFIAQIRGSEDVNQITDALASAHINGSRNDDADPDASIDEVASKMEGLMLSCGADSGMPDVEHRSVPRGTPSAKAPAALAQRTQEAHVSKETPQRLPRVSKKEPRVSEFFNIPHAFIRELTPKLIYKYCINIQQTISMDTLYCEFLQWCRHGQIPLIDIYTFANNIAPYVEIIRDSSGQCSVQFSRNSICAHIKEHDKKVAPFWDFDISRSFLDDIAHGRVDRLSGYNEADDGDDDCEIIVSKKYISSQFLKWRNENAITKEVSSDEFERDVIGIAGADPSPCQRGLGIRQGRMDGSLRDSDAGKFAFSIAKLRHLRGTR